LYLSSLQPVNTTRVNAANITTRVNALQSDKDRSDLGKAGFSEEFEVINFLFTRWPGLDVGLMIAMSWVQLPVGSLSTGYYLDG